MTKNDKIHHINELTTAKVFFTELKEEFGENFKELNGNIEYIENLIDFVIHAENDTSEDINSKIEDFHRLFKLFETKFNA